MRLYTDGKGHWAGTRKTARKAKKELAEKYPAFRGRKFTLCEVPVSKENLLNFLNKYEVATTRIQGWSAERKKGYTEIAVNV